MLNFAAKQHDGIKYPHKIKLNTNYPTVKSEKIIKRKFSRSPKTIFQGLVALSAHPGTAGFHLGSVSTLVTTIPT